MNNDWDLGAVVRKWFTRSKSTSPPLVNVIDHHHHPNQDHDHPSSSNLHNQLQPTQCHISSSFQAFDSLKIPTLTNQNNNHTSTNHVVFVDRNTSMAEVSCMEEWKTVHKRKNRERITQEHETMSLTDGFVWKKYGQRVVKGSTYPRDYYKCNSGHGCPAKRHVDTITVDPPKYVVAYYGFHNHPSS